MKTLHIRQTGNAANLCGAPRTRDLFAQITNILNNNSVWFDPAYNGEKCSKCEDLLGIELLSRIEI